MQRTVAIDQRSRIFQLKEAGASHRRIARELGISPSKVARELHKRAPEVRAERSELENGYPGEINLGSGLNTPLPTLPGQPEDQELLEQRRQLQLEEFELRRVQLRAQRLEATRRAQLLENPESNNGMGGVISLVMQAMDRNREEMRMLINQLNSKPSTAPPPAPSLTDQLASFRQMADTVASFAPPKPPSSSSDLEFVVAKEKLSMEAQDLAARREAEFGEQRMRAESEMRRNDAVARAIEQFAPAAAAWVERLVEQQNPKPAELPAPNPAPRPVVLAAVEVSGACPNCGERIAISGNQDERCPRCTAVLVAAEGRIRARLPNGELWPPLQQN